MVSLLEDIIRCIPASISIISEKTDVRSVFTGAYLCARAVRGSGFSDSRLVVLRQNPQFQQSTQRRFSCFQAISSNATTFPQSTHGL
jgi:hypothetical protein